MPPLPSEQRLKALEQSKEDLNILLDEAASIAGVQYDETSEQYARASGAASRSSNSFREQWLLRWIVKRLNEIAQTTPNADSAVHPSPFVTNVKTWSFLSYLLTIIPHLTSQEILLERNFTRLLTAASVSLLEDHDTTILSVSVPINHESHSERPRKRVKVTSNVETKQATTVTGINKASAVCLLRFVKVTQAWSESLQSESHTPFKTSRSVIPAWAESIREAGNFIGQVLLAVKCLATSSADIISKEFVLSIASTWLRLWHTFANSNSTVDRKTVDKTFNETILNSCLELYSELKILTGVESLSTTREIERQVALYTILPLRSIFNTSYAIKWGKCRDSVSWPDIKSIHQIFQDRLGTALKITTIADYQVAELAQPHWAALLVDFAARIVPLDDARRRQQEAPWLEVLTLCLAHLAFPHHMPGMHRESDGQLTPDIDKTPPNLDVRIAWPDELLQILATQGIKLSSSVKEYLTTSILSWRKRPVPLLTLAKVVAIDPNVFVHSAGQRNSPVCLTQLLSSISETRALCELEYNLAIERIVFPVMEAFAKIRKYDGILKLWIPNLEEALRVRTSATFTSDSIPVALLWDDDDTFTKFRSLCGQTSSSSFGWDVLIETINEIRTIADRIGPTVDIFARLAVLENIIKSRAQDLKSSEEWLQKIWDLGGLVSSGLKEPNDYQGQRWRLWSILNTLQTNHFRSSNLEAIVEVLEAACNRFHSMKASKVEKLPQSQRSALLMEQFQVFSLLVQHVLSGQHNDEAYVVQVRQLLSSEIKSLAKMIKKINRAPVQQESAPTKIWNGRLNSLLTIEQLVTGCLACLLQNLHPSEWKDDEVDKLLSPLEAALQRLLPSSSHEPEAHEVPALINLYLVLLKPNENHVDGSSVTTMNGRSEQSPVGMRNSMSTDYLSEKIQSQQGINKLAIELPRILATTKGSQKLAGVHDEAKSLVNEKFVFPNLALTLTITEDELKAQPELARTLAKNIALDSAKSPNTLVNTLLQLDLCIQTLRLHPGVVNQAIIDNLLKDLAIFSSSSAFIEPLDRVQSGNEATYNPSIIFNRLIEIVGLLLARYRRRLVGRNHLVLPVLQHLLRCFFYTPSKAYMYQNAATSRQKQEFRSSLPSWLKGEALPVSSAMKFSTIISSICNPTAASARSAHHTPRNTNHKVVELNDETKKAKRLAAQYMQYLVMEYARCVLDGVIQPDVREKLMLGLNSILDAMDRDLMKAMNSAMDPSSRAIFKGLYDDWAKHHKWDQT